jgi:hypothetical protein
MQDEELQPIYRRWAASRLGIDPADIREVVFETIYGGYCETCQYTSFGAQVYTTGNKANRTIEDDASTLMAELLTFAQEYDEPA